MSHLPLQNVHILITRPIDTAKALATEIETIGGHAIVSPTIDIELKQDDALQETITRLDQFDFAIFASRYAVKAVLPLIHARWGSLPKLQWGAIGASTAKELELAGISEVFYPKAPPFESETLLRHPLLQTVAGKSIVLFQGQNGRQLLKETLKSRGAAVFVIEAYQRVLPKSDNIWLSVPKIDIIVITSRAGLDNLLRMDNNTVSDVLALPLLVSNFRLLEYAHSLGFKKVVLGQGADNASVLQALIQWAKDRLSYESRS